MIKDGSRIIGVYGSNAIIGTVMTSRYYGKEFFYTVLLHTPLSFRWRKEATSIVLLSADCVKEAPIAYNV